VAARAESESVGKVRRRSRSSRRAHNGFKAAARTSCKPRLGQANHLTLSRDLFCITPLKNGGFSRSRSNSKWTAAVGVHWPNRVGATDPGDIPHWLSDTKKVMVWKNLGDLYWTDESGRRQPLAAGSGLVRMGDSLWVAADDLHHLIRVPLDGSLCGTGHRIFLGDLPEEKKARKQVKPDTEALIDISRKNEKRLLAFPSGSQPNRTRGAVVTVDHENIVTSSEVVDFTSLIQALDQRIPDLNIEGGAVWDGRLVLLQRGNGKTGFNGVVELDLPSFESGINGSWNIERTLRAVHEVQLPELGGVRLTFTDGEVVNGTLYFSAAAEGGKDTYLDGEVMGSAIGCLDRDFAPKILGTVERHKVEGLAFSRTQGDHLEFWLVTDADHPEIPSHLISAAVL